MDLSDQAVAILRANDRGGYTVPTNSGLYPAQWNWDSCLVALGFAKFDEERAWREIESLFAHQWPNGMVPHIVFHEDDSSYFPNSGVWRGGPTGRTSGITQNPVAATTIRRFFETARDGGLAEIKIKALLPKLVAWSDWFARARDPERTGLVAVLHPWEYFDNSPVWDDTLAAMPPGPDVQALRKDLGFAAATHRPTGEEYSRYLSLVFAYRDAGYDEARMYGETSFRVVDVGFNAILLRANKDLAFLLRRFGEQREADRIEDRARHSEAALAKLYDPARGLFYGYDSRRNAPIGKPSIGAFLTLWAMDDAAARFEGLVETLERWFGAVSFAAPSYDPGASDFDSQRYWRGPIWLVINWMLSEGLKSVGRADLAERVIADSVSLVENAGFREYYDPTNGAGLGGVDFTWTAAMYLVLKGSRRRAKETT